MFRTCLYCGCYLPDGTNICPACHKNNSPESFATGGYVDYKSIEEMEAEWDFIAAKIQEIKLYGEYTRHGEIRFPDPILLME